VSHGGCRGVLRLAAIQQVLAPSPPARPPDWAAPAARRGNEALGPPTCLELDADLRWPCWMGHRRPVPCRRVSYPAGLFLSGIAVGLRGYGTRTAANSSTRRSDPRSPSAASAADAYR
jgi:hypothetical protein